MNKKSAVVYFSCTGVTEKIAKLIAENSDSDIYKIEAKEIYTDDDLDWHVQNSRANREQNDAFARPEIANQITLDDYGAIYLGYPIWWGTMPKIINTFIETGALEGKLVIPFCTSGSSGIEDSVSDLENYNLKVSNAHRFNFFDSINDIKKWLIEIEK